MALNLNKHLIGMKYPRSVPLKRRIQCEVISVNEKEATIRNNRGKIYRIPVHIAQAIWEDQRDQKEKRRERT